MLTALQSFHPCEGRPFTLIARDSTPDVHFPPNSSLILFAFTAPYNKVHWIVTCIAEFLFSFSMFAIYVSFIPYLIDVYCESPSTRIICRLELTFIFSTFSFPRRLSFGSRNRSSSATRRSICKSLAQAKLLLADVSLFRQPLFAIQMYERLTIQGATSLLAGLSLLCAPLPFIFRRKGARLRERSTYAAANGSI